MCRLVLEETGLLPHPNAGILGRRELAELREVSASQGMMLESVSERLCGPGGPHEHAPDKRPAHAPGDDPPRRRAADPVHLGHPDRDRRDRRASASRRSSPCATCTTRYGHIQEVIVQNFRAKPDTPMAAAGEPGLVELMSACAIARLVMGPQMNIQAPPNLSADYGPLLLAGINDWGGVSPLTPDFVNPEAPWPEHRPARAALRRRRLRPARAAHDLPRVPGRRRLPRPGHARRGSGRWPTTDGLARDEAPRPLAAVAA